MIRLCDVFGISYNTFLYSSKKQFQWIDNETSRTVSMIVYKETLKLFPITNNYATRVLYFRDVDGKENTCIDYEELKRRKCNYF